MYRYCQMHQSSRWHKVRHYFSSAYTEAPQVGLSTVNLIENDSPVAQYTDAVESCICTQKCCHRLPTSLARQAEPFHQCQVNSLPNVVLHSRAVLLVVGTPFLPKQSCCTPSQVICFCGIEAQTEDCNKQHVFKKFS